MGWALDRRVWEGVKSRLPQFEILLRPMYASTPKNEYDLLGHAAVRYTLHRLFVQRHGWFVDGIFAGQGGSRWSDSSVTGVLVRHFSPSARNVFERRLSGRGLDFDGVAILASVIEWVILESAVQGLRTCYQLLGLPEDGFVSALDADKALGMQLAFRVSDTNSSTLAAEVDGKEALLEMLNASVRQKYPRWPATVTFLYQLRRELFPAATNLDFASVASIAMEVEGRWARWSSITECTELKEKLLAIQEGPHTGCITLSDFYKRSMNPEDGWQFTESPEYLRQLGALDESNPAVPRLLIPNYVNAPGNCLRSGKFYQACCISECEALLAAVENAVQTPAPRPAQIIKVVKSLSSSTVQARNVLSHSLRKRIEDIGMLHGGKVPLQGRLYAQWMHFAFPLECPFPQLSGTTNPVGVDLHSGSQVVSHKEAMSLMIAGMRIQRKTGNGTCSRWRDEEEIFVPTINPVGITLGELEQDASVWASVCAVTALSAFALMLAKLSHGIWSVRSSAARAAGHKEVFLV